MRRARARPLATRSRSRARADLDGPPFGSARRARGVVDDERAHRRTPPSRANLCPRSCVHVGPQGCSPGDPNCSSRRRTTSVAQMSGFGAKVSLTAIIKNIIKDYPEGTQILKELLQNGDDAKARHMTFLFDRRSHGTSSVAMGDEGPAEDGGRRMAAWQGPALLVL